MNSRMLANFLLVLAVLGVASASSEGGFFRRRVPPPSQWCPTPCPDLLQGEADRQTVEALTTRVEELRNFVKNHPDIKDTEKKAIEDRIIKIGVPGQRPVGTPLIYQPDPGLKLLPKSQVDEVGGEIGQVRKSLRAKQGKGLDD